MPACSRCRSRLTSTNGSVTLATLAGLTFSSGDGTADSSMTFTGTIAAINAALDGASFLGAANYNGAAQLGIAVDDLGNTGTGGPQNVTAVVALTVLPVNDAPVITSNGGGGRCDGDFRRKLADDQPGDHRHVDRHRCAG